MIIEVIKKVHARWIGHADGTPLRARIYHEVSLIALIGLPLALFVNIFIKVPLAGLVLSIAWLLIFALYLLSRYFGKLNLSIVLFSLGTSALMAFNYFINSGIQGPTVILYLLSLVFTLSMMPTRQFALWTVINVGIVGSLLLIEYYRGGSVAFSYANRKDLFLDTATTYLCVVACIGAILYYLIYSYEREKNNAVAASKALQSANDAKTRLLSILSHDLRSPLSSIESYLGTLYAYELSAEERQFVERSLLSETKNMQVMLHNLLRWTKAQMDGGVKVNLTKLNLSAIVTECLRIQRSAADLKGVSIRNQVDALIETLADRDMLKLVLHNLVNNAIKFTPKGGEIRVYSTRDMDSVRLHVADNGIGIPRDRQENLFTFHATSTYGTENEKGVGLGLILCKEYTELQRGRISFSSQPGNGTKFTLEFAE